MNMRKPYTLITIALFTTTVANAQQSGDLDSTFSADGIATTDMQPPSSDGALCMALQPDGRIILAGSSQPQVGGTISMALARYLSDGSLDPSFGTGGIVITTIGPMDDAISGIALQPDGKIVVGGSSWVNGSGYVAMVARYDSTGALDPTFSGDGWRTENIGAGSEDRIGSIALQANGRIVATGVAQSSGGDDDIALARYNTDGSLDTTFSGDGMLILPMGPGEDVAGGVAVQPVDQHIVITVYSSDGSIDDFTLVRFAPDGTLDPSFGTGGIVTTSFSAGVDRVGPIVLQPDGKIIAGGTVENGLQLNPALARYEADGDLDPSFDGDGMTTSLFSALGLIGSLALMPDGRIVAAGNSGTVFMLTVFNPDGSPDNTFSGDGALSMALGNYDYGNEVAVQPDGKILFAGYSNFNPTLNDFVVLRFHTDLSIGVLEFGGSHAAPLVFPDPISDEATLRFTLERPERLSVHLVDDAGRTVHRFVDGRNFTAGPQQLTLRFADGIAAGSYVLVISGEAGSTSVRVVKE